MNTELILAWADKIEAMKHTSETDPDGFNMNLTLRDCGTPACIAGHVAFSIDPKHEWCLSEEICQKALGLEDKSAFRLFYGKKVDGEPVVLRDITPRQAAACMRHLAATGEVDWEKAIKENPS